MLIRLLLSFLLSASLLSTRAQKLPAQKLYPKKDPKPYTLLIKNGTLIDPKTHTNETLDLAITGNRIRKIAKHIDETNANKIIDAKGEYITPGLVDIHTHVYFGNDSTREYAGGPSGLIPDSFAFKEGATTIVDAGSCGYREFGIFKERVIDHSKTRVLAFLNIVGAGMRENPYQQDTADMQSIPAAETAKKYHQYIVGFKVAHYRGGDWTPVDHAVAAGKITQKPVMIDFGGHRPPLSIQELFETHLRPHDIFTHCFAQLPTRESIVDSETTHLKPFIIKDQQHGIVFDVGYGGISFAFSQAIPALKAGFLPNSISTDIHVRSEDRTMPAIMSQFLAMGVDLPTIIAMATWNPAKEINRREFGHLETGGIADITIFKLKSGQYSFTDHTGAKIESDKLLECEMTIKDGKIVYNR